MVLLRVKTLKDVVKSAAIDFRTSSVLTVSESQFSRNDEFSRPNTLKRWHQSSDGSCLGCNTSSTSFSKRQFPHSLHQRQCQKLALTGWYNCYKFQPVVCHSFDVIFVHIYDKEGSVLLNVLKVYALLTPSCFKTDVCFYL